MSKITVCIPSTPERRKVRRECIKHIKENSNFDHEIFVFENELGGWVPAVREMMRQLPKDQLVVVIGDDCLPQPNWLEPLYITHKRHFPEGVGLCQPDDGIWGGSIASYPCATAEYLLRWIYSGYVHYHADEELAMLARARGQYRYVPVSGVIHNNPNREGEPPADETYAKEQKNIEADKSLFWERREKSNHYSDFFVLDWDKYE